MIKRCFDLVVGLLGFLVLMPFFLVVSIVILLTSGWPVLFLQARVGRDGRIFKVFKFRTMTVRREVAGGSFDAGDSSRVTAIGRVLRKTKADELPQLWNVIRGDMSLVGPRPEIERWVAAYPERWKVVLKLRPGLTDPASIVYRDEERILAESEDPERTYRFDVLPHKLDLYEEYVQQRSFFGDIGVLWRTLIAVVS